MAAAAPEEAIAGWNAAEVIAQAKELIHSSNYEKVGEARESVDKTIAQWVATVQAIPADTQDAGAASLRVHGVNAVIDVWRLYSALEMELRQFKQATKVFESAVSCAVAGHSKDIWLRYASFCVERKKFSNARKIFVRALKGVKESEQEAVWVQFHAFVQAHVDPAMSLETLKAQVQPSGESSMPPTPTADASMPASTTVVESTPPVQEQPAAPQTSTTDTAVVAEPTPVTESTPAPTQPASSAASTATPVAEVPSTAKVDEQSTVIPAVAFIDRTGKLPETESPQKRAAEPSESPLTKRPKIVVTPLSTEGDDTGEKFFLHIPKTLPVIPKCRHLLFDGMAEGESQQEIGNELLERLSDVLGDSAVFQGVRELKVNQLQRDRDTLYRWQELVGTQMKEGSELFAHHMDLERDVTEPRELIALKNQHLDQRREFVHRCQMSQQQFIEITEMDRLSALKAQQISLENMKIPEMTVTTDPKVIGLQRAIVALILEAEKLWREENAKTAARQKERAAPASTSTPAPRTSRPRRDDAPPAGQSFGHRGPRGHGNFGHGRGGGRGEGFGNRGDGYGNRGDDYGNRGDGYGHRGDGYGGRGDGYGGRGGAYNGRGGGYNGRGGGYGGRGDGYNGRGGGRRSQPRSSSPFTNNRGMQGDGPGGPPASFDHHPSTRLPQHQPQPAHAPFHAPSHQHQQQQFGHPQHPQPHQLHQPEYDPAYPQEYNPAYGGAPMHQGPAGRFNGPPAGAGGPGWQQRDFQAPQGGPTHGPPGAGYGGRRPSPKHKDRPLGPGGPPQQGDFGGKFGDGANAGPPQQRRGPGGPGNRFNNQDLPTQPLPYDDRGSYDYAPDNVPYNAFHSRHPGAHPQQQMPSNMPQQHGGAPFHHRPGGPGMGGRGMGMGGGPSGMGGRGGGRFGQQGHPSQYRHSSPPRVGGRGGRGGGGGRFGRR